MLELELHERGLGWRAHQHAIETHPSFKVRQAESVSQVATHRKFETYSVAEPVGTCTLKHFFVSLTLVGLDTRRLIDRVSKKRKRRILLQAMPERRWRMRSAESFRSI